MQMTNMRYGGLATILSSRSILRNMYITNTYGHDVDMSDRFYVFRRHGQMAGLGN